MAHRRRCGTRRLSPTYQMTNAKRRGGLSLWTLTSPPTRTSATRTPCREARWNELLASEDKGDCFSCCEELYQKVGVNETDRVDFCSFMCEPGNETQENISDITEDICGIANMTAYELTDEVDTVDMLMNIN